MLLPLSNSSKDTSLNTSPMIDLTAAALAVMFGGSIFRINDLRENKFLKMCCFGVQTNNFHGLCSSPCLWRWHLDWSVVHLQVSSRRLPTHLGSRVLASKSTTNYHHNLISVCKKLTSSFSFSISVSLCETSSCYKGDTGWTIYLLKHHPTLSPSWRLRCQVFPGS